MEHANPWDRRLGFWWIAEDHPDAPAVVDSPSGPLTYGELAGRANQLVHALRAHGLAPGAAVAAMLPNGVELIELSLACHQAGWYLLPLNTYLTAAEVATILDHSGAAAAVVGAPYAPAMAELADRRPAPVIFGVGGVDGRPELAAVAAEYPVTAPADRRPGGLFVYTSGTTGRPKGIRRRLPDGDPSEVANAAAVFGRAFDFRPFAGPMLVSTGMYHGGSHSYYMAGLHVGHALVIMERFDPEGALARIETHRVRSAYMVPTQFNRLLALPAEVRTRYDVSSLHSVVHSAAPCPLEVKRQMMAWWGPVIWETYGGMEGAATIAKPGRWLEHPGTVGRPVRGVTVSILDDRGEPVPTGESGLVYIENEAGFSYHNDDEGTRQAFHGKRFTLGDIGYLDGGGYLFIKDRAKDMIISGGVNIYPQEIEAVLITHPAVADVAVIGVPDADWGEQVKAVVQPAAGTTAGDALAEELLGWCRDRLAAYKCPRSVDFRVEMPRTEAGKLYKREIRDRYWQASGRAI